MRAPVLAEERGRGRRWGVSGRGHCDGVGAREGSAENYMSSAAEGAGALTRGDGQRRRDEARPVKVARARTCEGKKDGAPLQHACASSRRRRTEGCVKHGGTALAACARISPRRGGEVPHAGKQREKTVLLSSRLSAGS